MEERLAQAGAHPSGGAADECGPDDGPSLITTTTNTSGTHRAQSVNSRSASKEKRCAKTVVREQLDPQRCSFAPLLLWARPWYIQAVTEKEPHTRTPRGAKNKTPRARARVAAAVWVQARRTGRIPALRLPPPNGYTAGGSVQINMRTNDFSPYTDATNKPPWTARHKYLSVHRDDDCAGYAMHHQRKHTGKSR